MPKLPTKHDSIAVALDYIERGWAPIPVPPRSKRPTVTDWPNLRIGLDEVSKRFQATSNIGVLNGEPSGRLVDVDLDHPLARELADDFLPPTQSEFGRASALRSHRLYYATRPVKTHQRRLDKESMIAELRSTGSQTVFPGSVHPSGERIEWASNGEPASVTPEQLLAAVNGARG